MLRISGNSQAGFTLIEVVISVLILAFMSIMAYQGIEVVLNANERSQGDLAEEVILQKAWQQISVDMMHLRDRTFADGLGGIESAYETGIGNTVLRFSRGGGAALSSNPTGLTRINYVLQDGELIRQSWPIFVSPRELEPSHQILLNRVNNIVFEQLDEQNYFQPLWPPLNQQLALSSLPVMIRVTIEMDDGSSTMRQFMGLEI